MYYPLHVHTAKGSIGDSILKIKDYISKAKTMNLTHLAITNHGSLADMYEFYYECKKENITPIIGCEVYITDNQSERIRDYSHLVLIAKNDIGLKNLLYIVSDAQLNGMYYKPRTDLNIIKKHSEGIIALSACVAGEIPKAILNFKNADNDKKQETYNLILNKINDYKNVFKDNFYLEIQPANFTEQIYVNNLLVNLSNDLNIPLVATNDIHYLNQEDAFIHNAHICIERKQDLTEELLYKDDVYYLMDEKDITNRLKYLPKDAIKQAIKNTELIAKSCKIYLETEKLDMPSIPIPTKYNEDEYLAYITINTLNKRINEFPNPLEYMERALYELNVLKVLGFSGYFLTMKDIIDHAKNNDIPVGPGRGSVCGSLVAYLIGISSVNPIKYGLMFERFLSEQRVGTVPDIDTDIGSSKREEMFKYTIERHGKEKCALVSTFGIRKAKSAIKDVARILNINLELAETVAKLIPIVWYPDDGDKMTDLDIETSLKLVAELRDYQKDYPTWFELAIKLEGLPRTSSIHAAGTLIATHDLIDKIPLRKKSDDSYINATALNLHDAETAGFIKFCER